MKYKYRVTQTIYKYIEVEADNESDAFDEAYQMLEDGEIHFDDDHFLRIECNITPLSLNHSLVSFES